MKSTTKLGMFNTFFSIFGAILNAIEMIEGFYIWIFANSMWIIYNYKTKTYEQIPIWVIYIIICIIGIIYWS